jgi:hypothetical protein
MPGGFTVQSGASPNLQYDRGVLLLDPCDGTFAWTGSGTGSDYTVDLQAGLNVFHGTKFLRVQTKATTPADGDYAQATRVLGYPISNRLVLRLRVKPFALTATDHWKVLVDVYDGTNRYTAGFKFEPQVPKAYYYDSAAGWTEITEFAFVTDSNGWQLLELQLDLGTHEYLRAYFAGAKKELADVAFQNVGASTTRSVVVTLYTEADGALASATQFASIYVGEHEAL